LGFYAIISHQTHCSPRLVVARATFRHECDSWQIIAHPRGNGVKGAPTLAHMVGQANAQAKGKSNKQQVPYGIPEFLHAFGLDISKDNQLK
jgi:hypothetical protein